MKTQPRPPSIKVKRDLEFNKRLIRKLEDFWRKEGYAVEYNLHFNEKFNIHEIKSDSFKNGLPKGVLSESTKRKLVI